MRDPEFAPAERQPAPLHLLKMAVGIGDIDELRRFRAARLKDPEDDWQRAANVLIDELNELLADQQAFRARVSEIVHNEREALKLEPAVNLELPR